MQKLKLHLDDLSVESFDTIPMEKATGTVIGEEATLAADSCAGSACVTCSPSCWVTCKPRECYGGTAPTV